MILGVQAAAIFASFALAVAIDPVRAFPYRLTRPLDVYARLTLTASLLVGRDAAALRARETPWRLRGQLELNLLDPRGICDGSLGIPSQ